MDCDDPEVLEFNFRGIGARFDRKSFCYVAGLKFSKFPLYLETRDLTDLLWEKYFRDCGVLEQRELMKKLELFDEKQVEDNVTICKFYLLEMVLLVGDKNNSIICDHLKLLENKDISHVVAIEDLYKLESKIDDLDRKMSTIIQHFGIEQNVESPNTSEDAHDDITVILAKKSSVLETYKGHEFRRLVKGLKPTTKTMRAGIALFRYNVQVKMAVIKHTHPKDRVAVPSHDWTLDVNDDTLTNYMNGLSPLFSRNWKDMDQVYVPVNIEDKH
ncbi:hypothetical protein FNV43_RR05389 [Rhamnella rubrinervis]|uniref:DUF1985 domain-containing protein n=1 Tax=Rhamnella rubrinervis TaxID=2594499 RepID=A0A8K0MQE8_9ROSA|nr:hypothetical protein FNV43_RR05389 [Rhamnella rubrinervis]